MTAESGLRVEASEAALTVTLDRPGARNALSEDMVARLHDVCAQLEHEPKMLVIRATGTIFAAGADIAELVERRASGALRGVNSALFARIHALAMPTIAVVQGPAIGGGAELAYACDYRLGTPQASFSNPEPRLGIMAAAGATHRLPALIGEARAKDVLLFGRTVAAESAAAMGLLNQVVEPADIEAALGTLIAAVRRSSSMALRLTKRSMHAPEGAHPVMDDIAQAVLFDSPDKTSRMRAFLDRSDAR